MQGPIEEAAKKRATNCIWFHGKETTHSRCLGRWFGCCSGLGSGLRVRRHLGGCRLFGTARNVI